MSSWVFWSIFAVIVGGLVLALAWVWRRGMRADFFFTSHLIDVPAIYALFYFVLVPLLDWLRDKQTNLITDGFFVAIISVFYIAFFSLGFLHGRLRRRKREGIIGLS